jgi:transposase
VAKGKRTGRIPKLTPETQAAIARDISAGVPREHAAERAGIHRATLFRWLARGRKKAGPFRDLCDAVKRAEADAVAASVARIRRAAQGGQVIERTTTTTTRPDGSSTTKTVEKVTAGQWAADAWWLERRHPGEFALRYRKEIEDAAVRAVERAQRHGTTPPPDAAGRRAGTGPATETGPDPSDV